MMIDKRLVNFVPEAKKFVFLTVLLRVFALTANTVFIFSIAAFLNAGFSEKSVIFPLILMLFCILVSVLSNLCASYTAFRSSSQVKTALRSRLYEKLLSFGADYQEKTPTAQVIQTAVDGVEQIETWFSAFLPQFYYSMIAAVLTFSVLAFLNLKMALVLLLCVPLIPISMAVVQNIAKKILGKYWAQYANLADNFLENLQGLTTLQIYEADGFKATQMAREAENFRRVTMKVLSMQLNSIIIMDGIAYGGAALGIAFALSSFYSGTLPLSHAFVCILLSADFFIPLRRLGSAFHTAMNGVTASKNIFEILDQPCHSERPKEVEESGAPCHSAGRALQGSADASFLRSQKSLRNGYAALPIPSADSDSTPLFQTNNLSVTFSTSDSLRTVLKNCSVEIPRGSFVAFVGKSGSGKSTLAKVFSGIFKNYDGSVLLNGTELTAISPASLHDFVTYISHRDWIFAGSVRDCLLEGNETATDDEMKSVLSKVNLLNYIEENGGLSFELKEGGSNISGGQKQRLSIARALLHKSELYIFDEATSNIDVESEQVILNLIRSLKGTKTVIMISHIAENCAGADSVYEFENGHAELVSASKNDEILRQAQNDIGGEK
ncbi:MAG: ABC transporter ATP-binding protein/permease [Treponema sp.]|nr:ABC transporter ATP-binding protein/permease [Treponema sp.]